MLTDKEQVVAACQRKNPEAFKRLYEELAPAMLGVCMRYTHSLDEAQDLLHDGFIKAYENIGKLGNPSMVEAWLYQIMVNLSIDYVKARSKVICCDLEQMEAEGSVDTAEEVMDFDRDDIDVEEVLEVVRSMPYHYQLVFNMKDVEGMDYELIAKILKMPLSTVRTRVHRARLLIKKELIKKGIII
ncbi:MAG: RNA polymerase sigma factor [Bacteroidales bacterium]|nr:RNA polymerase sigma factor [Bacteroidales bacterium]